MQRAIIASCLSCRWEADSILILDAHNIDMHGIAPSRDPKLGDPVYVSTDFRFFVVAIARSRYRCRGCGKSFHRRQANASHPHSYDHYCVPTCANFDNGVAHAKSRLPREAA